jgi:hypothetical protein
MITRTSLSALGFAIALGAPLVALADSYWERTSVEAGWVYVAPKFGAVTKGTAPTDTKPLLVGDISADRQYKFLGEEGGWQLRPMQYRFENGRFVHVDDPAGHMERHADRSPLTEQERAALQRSGGG